MTNKISESEQQGIPHHLLGHVSLNDEPAIIETFQHEAQQTIRGIRDRGNLPTNRQTCVSDLRGAEGLETGGARIAVAEPTFLGLLRSGCFAAQTGCSSRQDARGGLDERSLSAFCTQEV